MQLKDYLESAHMIESEKLRKERIRRIFTQSKSSHHEEDYKEKLTEISLGTEDFDALSKEPGFELSNSSLGHWYGIEVRLTENPHLKGCTLVGTSSQITHIQIIENPSERRIKKWHRLSDLKRTEKISFLAKCKDCNSYLVSMSHNYTPESYVLGTCWECHSANVEWEICSICGNRVDGTIEHLPGKLTNEHHVIYWEKNGKYICLKCHALNPSNRINS